MEIANGHSEYWDVRRDCGAVPPPETAEDLARAYWSSIPGALARCVHVDGDPLGPVRLRVSARGPVILAFGAAVVDGADRSLAVRFPIVGGFAATRPGGELRLVVREADGGVAIGVVVDGYHPRFERLSGLAFPIAVPYNACQHAVHRWVTRRSLVRIAEAVR